MPFGPEDLPVSALVVGGAAYMGRYIRDYYRVDKEIRKESKAKRKIERELMNDFMPSFLGTYRRIRGRRVSAAETTIFSEANRIA